MSVESIAIALHHSRAKGAAKLVLIGIANHDGDGGAWPSVATLAKYAHVDPRSVQRALGDLERLGEIRRLVSAGGDHSTADHLRPNLYNFRLTCPASCDRSSRHRVRGEVVAMELSTGVTPTSPGDAGVRGGVTPTSPEPSLNRTIQIQEETQAIARAREEGVEGQALYSAILRSKCPARHGRPHRYEPSGYCTDCAARDPRFTESQVL